MLWPIHQTCLGFSQRRRFGIGECYLDLNKPGLSFIDIIYPLYLKEAR